MMTIETCPWIRICWITIFILSPSWAWTIPKSYQAYKSSRSRGLYQQRWSVSRIHLSNNVGDEDPDVLPVVFHDSVTLIDEGRHHLVVNKPSSVVCHHSDWCGSRSQVYQVPMLQRVREAVGGRKVNLVHRLDRGASGCLLLTYTDDADSTAVLSAAMSQASKTYVALVRGEGILRGDDLKTKGWFVVDRPIKNEKGKLHNATTYFRFVAGQDNDSGQNDKARASLVLARPVTGRWHQVRRHLNGLSHPILGDSTHGNSQINREWREGRGLPAERICLHLLKLSLPPTEYTPNGIDVECPLPDDMMTLLRTQLPDVLRDADTILKEEGLTLQPRLSGRTIPIAISIDR
ncbi:RNA pseudouridylate synthase [Fragilaria crotonensis]|nr:RNA pseudouridylate synthase [Fragilaria crotonensis]